MTISTNEMISQDRVYEIRVKNIMDQLMVEHEIFQKNLNNQEAINDVINLMKKFTFDEFMSIDDNSMKERIKKIMVVKGLSNLLVDLTPDQIKIFDDVVNGD